MRQGRMDTRPRPLDGGDPRTPMAWQHRNLNYQHQNSYSDNCGGNSNVQSSKDIAGGYHETNLDPYTPTFATHGVSKELHYLARLQIQSKAAPPSVDIISSSTCTDEPDADSHHKFDANVPVQPVPTWDGEPCPVHHCIGMVAPVPVAMPLPIPMILPAPQYPHPMVLQTASPTPSPVPLLPLPVREHLPAPPLSPPVKVAEKSKECAGKVIVLWIVLGVVAVGIILAIVLKFVRI